MTNNIIKFLTAGHVDDGKSTLIGKLLYDTNSLYEDQIESIKNLNQGEIDFSLFVEGLESERRQKITIDVAYRYFDYENNKFIIADAPGHEQYTKNMAVAAANSNIAVILIDAADGVKTQTIRHSYICHLFGIKKFIIAINKMDLVDYDQKIFEKIKQDYLAKITELKIEDIDFVPISAINSDNIITNSPNITWYDGKTLLDLLLESTNEQKQSDSSRFLIQNVLKSNNERFYQGKLFGNALKIGDKIDIYPAQLQSKIKDINFNSKTNLTIILEDDVDIDRGAIFAKEKIKFGNKFGADLIWFSNKNFNSKDSNSYHIKINHNYLEAKILQINHLIDLDNSCYVENSLIKQNQINDVDILLSGNVAFDYFSDNKFTGSFLLIDKNDNETLGVGLITRF
ncbi:GTP-binding protein [Rickettsiales bacterium]|nr:GTP-binding protein [Rickettsiales bacterium]